MAWMPQHLPKGQFPFTVEELLRAGTEETAVLDAAGELGIGGLLQRPLSALSGGQRQRAYLARALGMLHEGASLLLADEAERSEERRVGKECRSRWSPYH